MYWGLCHKTTECGWDLWVVCCDVAEGHHQEEGGSGNFPARVQLCFVGKALCRVGLRVECLHPMGPA